MSAPILFYVSGHGFGHARRVAQVITTLRRLAPALPIHVRTSAPAHLFQPFPAENIFPTEIDAGMAEEGPLRIDPIGTLVRLEDLLARRGQILQNEIEAVRAIGPALIVADIPFLAGEVAAATGVPCLGMSNFTWDWICDPILGDHPRYRAVRENIVAGYAKMNGILQLPFGGVSEGFSLRRHVPLIAGRSNRDRSEVRASLSIDPHFPGAIVLVAQRGGLSIETLHAAASNSPERLFLLTQPAGTRLPANVRNVSLSNQLDFSDLVSASDVVVSKLGYGIVSDCMAAGTALLWPRRIGFREDGIVETEGPRFFRMREIPWPDFERGAWGMSLSSLLAQPQPPEVPRVDGAQICAAAILDYPRSIG